MPVIKKLYIYTDGASRGNPGKSGAGIIIRDSSGIILKKGIYLGHTTNNVAEYSAFIHGLKEAKKLGGNILLLHTDSELLAKQIQGSYKVKDAKLKILFKEAKKLLTNFLRYEVINIQRNKNREADKVANEAIESEG
jgi:ribonuclease HI